MSMTKVALVAALAALLAAAAQSQTPRPTPRPAPKRTPPTNERPAVKLVPAAREVVLASECYEGQPASTLCQAVSPIIKLAARATDPDGDTLLYTYSTTGGRVTGDGPEVTLDLTGTAPGVYAVTVAVDDGNGGVASDEVKITVARCTCPFIPPPPCPTVTVSCPDTPGTGSRLVFTANVSGGDPNVKPAFKWSASAGKVVSGQGTDSITVETNGMPDRVTATVNVGGYDRSCQTSTSCTATRGDPPAARKVDEYGDIAVGDEKLRLDNLAVELLNDPASQIHLICYGGRRGGPRAAPRRCERAKNYLISSRGIAVARVLIVNGGYREGLTVEAWMVPPGATPPRPSPTVFPPGRDRR